MTTTVYTLRDVILLAFITGVVMALEGEVTEAHLHDSVTGQRVIEGFMEHTSLQPDALDQIIGVSFDEEGAR